MKKYMDVLKDQYQKATGVKNIDLKSSACLSEVKNWAINRKETSGVLFTKFLLDINKIDYQTSHTIEVGKGVFDTVVRDSDNNFNRTVIASLYGNTFKNKENIYDVNIVFSNGKPYGLCKINNKKQIIPINTDYFSGYLLQNPYNEKSIKNIDKVFKNNDIDIILGVFGNMEDKDRNEKIKLLKDIKLKLKYSKFIEGEIETKNNYAYFVANDRKNVKKLK